MPGILLRRLPGWPFFRKEGLLILLLAGNVLLWTSHLNRWGFWEDEIYIARDIGIARLGERESRFIWSWTRLTYESNNHPPLYYLLMTHWARLGGFTETHARAFNLAPLLLALWCWARTLSRLEPGAPRLPHLGLLLAAASSFLHAVAAEARMYSLALFWAALSFRYLVESYLNPTSLSPRRKAFWTLGAANLGGLYTHYYYLFWYLAQLALAALLAAQKRISARAASGLLLPALLFLPWIPQLMRQYERKYRPDLWILGPDSDLLYGEELLRQGRRALSLLLLGDQPSFPLLLLVAAALLVGLFRGRARGLGHQAFPILFLILVSSLLLVATDLYHHTLTLGQSRYLFFLYFPLLTLLSVFMVRTPRWVAALLLGVWLAFNLQALLNRSLYPSRPDWRHIVRGLEDLRPSAPLLVPNRNFELCVRFYASQPTPLSLQLRGTAGEYPFQFWSLLPYPNWNRETERFRRELESRFQSRDRFRLAPQVWAIEYHPRKDPATARRSSESR